jgi:hypothetical protein
MAPEKALPRFFLFRENSRFLCEAIDLVQCKQCKGSLIGKKWQHYKRALPAK